MRLIFYSKEKKIVPFYSRFCQPELALKISENWREELKEELSLPYIRELENFISSEREHGYEIYPSEDNIFSAFSYTPYSEVKVVIVGQDPYHGKGQAHGLSFSVPEGIPLPLL